MVFSNHHVRNFTPRGDDLDLGWVVLSDGENITPTTTLKWADTLGRWVILVDVTRGHWTCDNPIQY